MEKIQLPYDSKAEQRMLLLLENGNSQLIDQLEIEHFFIPLHQHLFEVMKLLYVRDGRFDGLTIFREAKGKSWAKDHKISDVLNDELVTVASWDSLFTILDNLRIRRSLVCYGQKIIRDASLNEDAGLVHSIAKKEFDSVRVQKVETLHSVKNIMFDLANEWEKRQNGESGFKGFKTGYYDLDRAIKGYKFGNLDIIAGRPSHGKTTFAINCVINALKQGVKVLFVSLEMSKEEVIQQIMCIIGKMTNDELESSEIDWNKITLACNQLMAYGLWIDDESKTPEAINASIHAAYQKYGIQEVVLDYIQMVDYRQGHNENFSTVVSKFIYQQKHLAKDLDIHYSVISQLNRDPGKREGGKPILTDLKDSGGLEQAAYKVLMIFNGYIHDPEENSFGQIEILIRKNRRGKLGSVMLGFSDTTEIYNLVTG